MKIYVKGGITYWILDEDDDVLTTEQELGLIRETQTEEIVAYLKTEDGVVPIYPTSVSPEITGYWLLNQDDKILLNDDADKDIGIWAKWQYSFAIYSETDNSLTFYTGFAAPKVGSEYKHKVVTEVFTDFEDTTYTNASQVPWNSYRTSIKYVRFEDSYTIVWPTATAYWFNGFTSLVDLDVSNLNTSKTTSYSNFATGCTSLKSVTISSRFTLFSKSSQLVDQMTWYDIDKNIVSNNYLISFSATGTYWNDIYAIPTKQAIAIYSASDNSLTFYYDYMPKVGTVYNGKVVTAFYYDFAATNYNSASEVPWASYATSVKKVVFDSSYYEVQTYTGFGHDEYYILDSSTDVVLTDKDAGIAYKSYLSTAYWFSGFTNCTSFDLTGLYTATITNMQYMFYGCTSVTTLDLSGFDTGNVVTYNNFLINCDSLEEVIISDAFDLFTKSDKALVSQQYWIGSQNEILDEYLIGTQGNIDCLVREAQAFAVYSYYDDSLTFYYNAVPTEGLNYNGKVATGVYTGIDTDTYSLSSLPWYSYALQIASVSFNSNFANVKPISTAFWFADMTSCKNIALTNLDTSNVTNMESMFMNLHRISSIDLSKFNTSKVTNMRYMFFQCLNLISIDVSTFDTSKVTTMSYMFSGCRNLTELDLTGFNTSNVTICTDFVTECDSLNEIKISSNFTLFTKSSSALVTQQYWHDSDNNNLNDYLIGVQGDLDCFVGHIGDEGFSVYSATDNSLTFYSDIQTNVPTEGSSYNGKTATNVYKDFEVTTFNSASEVPWASRASSVKSVVIDESYGNVRGNMGFVDEGYYIGDNNDNVLMQDDSTGIMYEQKLSMAYWFYGFTSCTSFDLANLYTAGVTNMRYMFYNCSSVTKLDLSSFNTSNVVAYKDFMISCTNLEEILIGSNFDLFKRSTDALVSQQYWHDTDGYNMNDYLIGVSGNLDLLLGQIANVGFAIYSDSDNSLTFYADAPKNIPSAGKSYGGKVATIVYTDFVDATYTGGSSVPWYLYRGDIKSVSFDSSFENVKPVSTAYWFYYFQNCTSIDLTYLDTSNVTTMYVMFSYCQSLTSLDVSNFNTSNVTDMVGMFNHCETISSLNLSSFDTSKVTTMHIMFQSCYDLTSVDVSNFDTSSCTDMGYMFNYNNALQNVNVSNFNTSNVTDMHQMFYDCEVLQSLDVSNFDTSNVIDMYSMFRNCKVLQALDVSNFNTSNVTTMQNMFRNCEALKTLDVSNFNTSNVTDMSYMFEYCRSLTSLDVSNFNTSNVTTMYHMFYDCEVLQALDVSNFDTSNVTTMRGMFGVCEKLTSLDVSNWDTSNVTSLRSTFYHCNSLTSLNVSNWDTSKVTDMSSMFEFCEKLTSPDVSNFNTSNVTDMADLFDFCYKITSLDVSNWKTSKVTDMTGIFFNNSALTTIYSNDSNFVVTALTNDNYLFADCPLLVGGNGTKYADGYGGDKSYAHVDTASNPGYFTKK